MPKNPVAAPRIPSATMNDNEAAVSTLKLSRDQILGRLWQLAYLSPEQTRGSIAGQVKAMAMIVAIEGLIPDRRLASAQAQSAPAPVPPSFYVAEPTRRRQQQAEATQPDGTTIAEAQPAAPQSSGPQPSHPANAFVHSRAPSWVPDATGLAYSAVVHKPGNLRLPGFKNTRSNR